MNGLLYQGDNISGEDLSVKIWKAGQFMFYINNNEITYKVPLKIWCRFGWKMEKFGVTLSDHYEAAGQFHLYIKHLSILIRTGIWFQKQPLQATTGWKNQRLRP